MLTMTEPQVWVLIGVFAAAIFGMLTITSTLFVRVIRSEIGGLRGEMHGIHERLDRLDRHINALMKHTFGIDRD